MMQRYKLIFNDVKDKARFIDIANKKDYDIDIKYGNSTYDGKSALSIISLPDKTDLPVVFNTESYDVSIDFKKWIVV